MQVLASGHTLAFVGQDLRFQVRQLADSNRDDRADIGILSLDIFVCLVQFGCWKLIQLQSVVAFVRI